MSILTVNQTQADKFGLTLEDLQKLAEGKSCPVYGVNELLHVRKTRGGKVTVFNTSEKARSEKISKTKQANKAAKLAEGTGGSGGGDSEVSKNSGEVLA